MSDTSFPYPRGRGGDNWAGEKLGKLSDRRLRLSGRTNVCLREMGGLPSSQSDKAWVDEKKRT